MTATNTVDLLIGLAVLVFVLVRQLQPRPVRDDMRLPLILAIIGVVELVRFLDHGHHGAVTFAALCHSDQAIASASHEYQYMCGR